MIARNVVFNICVVVLITIDLWKQIFGVGNTVFITDTSASGWKKCLLYIVKAGLRHGCEPIRECQ
jgi:hypothetical protein